jgi:hypothetical protein
MAWSQEDEHREIVRGALVTLAQWARNTGQIEEEDAINATVTMFSWKAAAEHFDHADEWYENMDQEMQVEWTRDMSKIIASYIKEN